MYKESDYLPVSGLQHLRFCPRQCALIHIERLWNENFFTAKGRILHEKVHSREAESRKKVRIERNLMVSSARLGLAGCTDAVEFYENGDVLPIEYKSGKTKEETCDEVQLCAQALCLEEMLGVTIETGALYYFKTKKRVPVSISESLRKETVELSEKFHLFMENGVTPDAFCTAKCNSCSLVDDCFPDLFKKGKSVKYYLKQNLSFTEESPCI